MPVVTMVTRDLHTWRPSASISAVSAMMPHAQPWSARMMNVTYLTETIIVIDQKTSEEFEIPAKTLMERAGQAVFEAIREFVPTGSHIAIFCGKGTNVGDGFVVA